MLVGVCVCVCVIVHINIHVRTDLWGLSDWIGWGSPYVCVIQKLAVCEVRKAKRALNEDFYVMLKASLYTHILVEN